MTGIVAVAAETVPDRRGSRGRRSCNAGDAYRCRARRSPHIWTRPACTVPESCPVTDSGPGPRRNVPVVTVRSGEVDVLLMFVDTSGGPLLVGDSKPFQPQSERVVQLAVGTEEFRGEPARASSSLSAHSALLRRWYAHLLWASSTALPYTSLSQCLHGFGPHSGRRSSNHSRSSRSHCVPSSRARE